MAQQSWPFHNGTSGTPVLEDQWSIMARLWAASGVIGAPGDANLQVYANSSGRQVFVRPGRAAVRGHYYLSDAEEALTIGANSSGNPRIDRVVLRLDPAANSVILAVKQGTPAGAPTAPSLSQTDTGVYELTLARVAVANGAASIAAGNVTDERVNVAPPPIVASSGNRPAAPASQQMILEVDTGAIKVWDGNAWTDIAAVDTPARTAASAANNNANGRASKAGDTFSGPVNFNSDFRAVGPFNLLAGFTSTQLSEFDATVNLKGTVGINRDAMGPHADFFDLDLMGVAPGGAALQQIKRASGATLRSYILATSTRRVKKNVKRATDVPDVTMLQPSVFQWKAAAPVPFAGEKERDQLGLIAEDVAEVDPRFVVHDDDDKPTALNVGALIAGLVAKVTELQARIEALET